MSDQFILMQIGARMEHADEILREIEAWRLHSIERIAEFLSPPSFTRLMDSQIFQVIDTESAQLSLKVLEAQRQQWPEHNDLFVAYLRAGHQVQGAMECLRLVIRGNACQTQQASCFPHYDSN